MAPNTQTGSTGDLRSNSVDYHRFKNKKSKWSNGSTFGPGRRPEENHPRPARVFSEYSGIRPDGIHASTHKARTRKTVRGDILEYNVSDSSADEDVTEASAAPAPDADITYSFDAVASPSHGSQVLGQALAKAIERYEVKATDKLVSEEYEVLGNDGETIQTGKGKKAILLNDEDDFELI